MAEQRRAPEATGPFLLDGVVTLAAVVIAFAALNEITTDPTTTFTVEWIGLAGCGVWLLFVSWRLAGCGHLWLGAVSVIALAVGVFAAFRIRPGIDPLSVDYLATLAALIWFVGLSGILATRSWWERPQNAA